MKNENLKTNVLYVDDNEANLILFEATFETEYNVLLAHSGEEGLELLNKRKFEIIISDQRMPGMSGTELMEKVQEKHPDVMRFIITAYSDYDTVVDLINKGRIYGYFNKPFDSTAVRFALNKALEVYELRETNRKMLMKLEKTNRELLEIDKSKTKFLGTLSNEIRDPINKIMSTVHVLKDKIEADELLELINYLDSAASKLEAFSYAASQLARINDGAQSIGMTEIFLKDIIELSIIEKKNLIDEAGVLIEMDKNGNDVIINGDNELLICCLTSLIYYSVSSTELNSSIKIFACENNGERYIEINYLGSEIQLINLKRFFSDDEMVFDSVTQIELLLAKQIMKLHGGRVTILHNSDNTISIRMVFSKQIVE